MVLVVATVACSPGPSPGAGKPEFASAAPSPGQRRRPVTPGLFRPASTAFFLRSTNTPGDPEGVVGFGAGSDLPLAGDWDGAAGASIGGFRPRGALFLLRNRNQPGEPDLAFAFGVPGDQPLAGDWDGDGITTVGVYRPGSSSFHL